MWRSCRAARNSSSPDLNFSRTRLFVRDIVGGPNQVRVFDLDGKPAGKLPLARNRRQQRDRAAGDGEVLFDVSTYLRPRLLRGWDPATGKTRRPR
jgi:prolyl oligopeptidase